jgi:putative component of toxin-antitoxin plasmid stabilization module
MNEQETADHAFFKASSGLSKSHEEAIKRRIDNLSLNELGHRPAILHHFRSTGVLELKLDGGYRIFLTQTGEKEYTILGITTKENQSKDAQSAI